MKILRNILLLATLILSAISCDKNTEEISPPTQYDNSLILSRGSGAKLVLTNPADGKDLFISIPTPNVEDVKSLKAGYMCKNAVFTAKTMLKNHTMSIYTCNAKTGNNTKAITPNNLYVYSEINVSSAGPNIVFPAKSNDQPEYQSIYSIVEDGSGLTQLSKPLESVTGMDGNQYELQPTSFPAFSPDGTKIAFDALVLTLPNHWDYYEFILIMNDDGTNKTTVFSEKGKHVEIYDICWTKNGKFLLFVKLDNDNGFHRRVKALNIKSKKITDITTSLEINGDQVYNINTSPNSDKIVFNQHLGGGSDLFIAEYETHDDVLTIKGEPKQLTDSYTTGYHYYTPCWQIWDEQ
jgi:Tol biopolymer transport system component